MIPLRVHAENFATYPTLDFEFPSGLTAILGRNGLGDGIDSNGAGKSTLLQTVPVALFGGLQEFLTAGEEACSLELEFMHDIARYRVRRTYSARGRGKSTLDFEEHRPEIGDWRPLTEDSQAATQELVARTIRLSEDTFTHSVFAAQGARHFADPSLPPRERKQILADALGLGVWDHLLEIVRTDVRAAEVELAGLDARLGDMDTEIGDKALVESELEQAWMAENAAAQVLLSVEAAETAVGRNLAEVETTARVRSGLEAAAASARGRFQDLNDRSAAAREAGEQAAALAAELDLLATRVAPLEALELDLRDRETAEAAATAQERERTQGLARAAELRRVGAVSRDTAQAYLLKAREMVIAREKLEMDGMGVCRECGQALHGDALALSLAALEHDVEALEAQAAACSDDFAEKFDAAEALEMSLPESRPLEDLAPLRKQVVELRAAQIDLVAGRERLAGLTTTAGQTGTDEFRAAYHVAEEAVTNAEHALAQAEPVSAERLMELQLEHRQAQAEVTNARHELDVARTQVARCDERLNRIASLAERHAETLLAHAGLLDRLELLRALEAAYGRNGIPALILEASAVPHLEAEAQRILAELGVPFRVELVTQRETKAGGVKDTLDVVVHEPSGARRYETYSGGEQTRLEFALRIALARLVASRSGSQAGLLALDELSFLDGAGMSAVASVLRGLSEFRSVLLVSHDDRLSDAFDQQVVVVRDEDGSRLEVAA